MAIGFVHPCNPRGLETITIASNETAAVTVSAPKLFLGEGSRQRNPGLPQHLEKQNGTKHRDAKRGQAGTQAGTPGRDPSLVGISSSPAWWSRARAGPGDNKRAFFASLCCRLPSRGPFGGPLRAAKNAQPHLEVSHLLAGAVFHKKVSVRASKQERPRLEAKYHNSTSAGPGIPSHESRRHGMWGMGCRCRQSFWFIHKSLY